MVDDEDLLPELPSLGELGDEELADDELGLESPTTSGGEDVGLDDATGVDDDVPLFALELPPKDAVSTAADDDLDAIPVDGLDGEDEYGWTDASEANADEPWDDDLDLLGAEDGGGDDGGEEGVDDVFEIGAGGDDDVSHLPALRGYDPEDDAEDLPLGADALVAASVREFDEEKRTRSIALLPRLTCEVRELGGAPVLALDTGLAGGEKLFAVRERLDAIDAPGIDAPITSLAVSGAIVVALKTGVVLRAARAGEPFTRSGELSLARVVRERGAARLWGTTEGGALHRSDDVGESWTGPLLMSPVVAFSAPEDGGLVALCAGRDARAQIVRSSDGGQRWAALDAPPLSDGTRWIAACGDWIAVSCEGDVRGPHLCGDRGKTWTRLPGVPHTGPMVLAREAGGLSLYAVHQGEDGAFIARHRPGGGDSGLLLELDARVHALAIERHGAHTVILAASDAGLFRIEIDPERV